MFKVSTMATSGPYSVIKAQTAVLLSNGDRCRQKTCSERGSDGSKLYLTTLGGRSLYEHSGFLP